MALRAALERPLPPSLPPGTGTAVFCLGHCFDPDTPVSRLWITVDGVRHEPEAFGMPRTDLAGRPDPEDPDGRRARSGWWGSVPIPPRSEPGTIAIALVGEVGGVTQTVPVGEIPVVGGQDMGIDAVRPADAAPELIAVCMATFEPDPALFATQIATLKAQTDRGWVCVISDDCSRPEHHAAILATIGDDPRFAVSRSPERLGFYRNFERSLRLAPHGARLLALADQDDRWRPDKLARLRSALGRAGMAYSDMRLTDGNGRVLRETLWAGRRNNHSDLASMVIANTITGAATLFRREVIELSLPFPDPPGFQFHDHWLGLIALAAGDIAFVPEPLYDYVQHSGAVFGDVTHGSRLANWRRQLTALPRVGVRWRAAYFYGYCNGQTQALALLVRCGDRLTAAKRRALERYLDAERTPAGFAWMALRPLRTLAGHTETLGTEAGLAQGLIWKWVVGRRARAERALRRPWLNTAFPPPEGFSQERLRRWRARF